MTFSKDQVYCILDYETFSEAPLRGAKSVGAYEYSVHESTSIICVAWRIGTRATLRDAPTRSWRPGSTTPGHFGEFFRTLLDPSIILTAHNALFEQAITLNVFTRCMYSKEKQLRAALPPERWLCTASLASAMALPRNLEGAAQALGLAAQKDMAGNKLMLKYCKPRKPTKHNPATRHTDEADLARIVEYCETDIATEVELFLTARPLSAEERQVWILDQKINLRGYQVDTELVTTVLGMIAEETKALDARCAALTDGEIRSATQRQKVLDWVNERMPLNITLPDLQKKTVDYYARSIGGQVGEMLWLRLATSKTSTAKYQAFKNRSASDGRVRDNFLYHGASTGRWAGAGAQVQNLPRAALKDADQAAGILKTGDLDWIRLMYGEPMQVFSDCLRSVIVASPGKIFDVGDYAGIEARVLFWIAKHEDGLQAFRDGRDLYRELAATIFNTKLELVTSDQRFVGKTSVLGCLAERTPVKTKIRGWVWIEDIQLTDELWDGLNWVRHQGVLPKGTKSVINLPHLDIESTPDHRFLLNGTWQTAVEIASQEDTLRQLSESFSASGLLSASNITSGSNVVSLCAAYAELLQRLESTNYGWEKLLDASVVSSLWPDKKAEDPRQLAAFLVTQGLKHVGGLVTAISKNDALTPMIETIRGMVVAELNAPSLPLEHFWNTLLRLMGLTSPVLRSTELIMTGVMNPETYESLAKALITKTALTFDIADAGPNNCFQVNGLIAHNCGFGMGPKKFQITCANQGQVVSEDVAKAAIAGYRETHKPVARLWSLLEQAAIAAVQNPGKKYTINRTSWWADQNVLWCALPSGRRLAYYGPCVKYELPFWAKSGNVDKIPVLYHFSVNPLTKKWGRDKTYGGLLTENVVQATARDVLAAAMLRLEAADWEIALHVHDEIVAEVALFGASHQTFCDLMATVPPWAEGLPVQVEGFRGVRYRK